MPTSFVIQEHLTLASALSLLGEGEERKNQSCLRTVNVQAWSTKTREKLLSFAQAGCHAEGQKSGLFCVLGMEGGEKTNHSYTQKCCFPPSPSFVQTLWVNGDVSVCLGSKSHCFCQLQNVRN